jgi:predicted MPP superfamily phosphohydrolase
MDLPRILIFVLFWLGHGYLLMLTLNVAYSQPIHRKVLKVMRLTWALLLVAGPPAFGFIVGFDLLALRDQSIDSTSYLIPFVYSRICWMAGLGFLIATMLRLLPHRPAVVRDERTETVDIAKELGHRPVGDGKYRHVAKIGFNDLFRVEFTTLTLAVPGLPASWDGLTILHLSDLHFYGTPGREYYDTVVRRCLAAGPPDLLVVSGDIIDGPQYLDWIEPVLSPLKWNVAALAIVGNHDWWQDFEGVRKRLAALGMHVLSRRWDVIDIRGERLIAIGHEGPWFQPPPDLAGCPTGFRLLVSHTPDNIRWARANNCQLMLSGHNHGGQIRLPIIGSMFVPSAYSRKYDMGTFHEPPTVLHVNRGLAGKEAIRFRCHPQVSRIVLRSA